MKTLIEELEKLKTKDLDKYNDKVKVGTPKQIEQARNTHYDKAINILKKHMLTEDDYVKVIGVKAYYPKEMKMIEKKLKSLTRSKE